MRHLRVPPTGILIVVWLAIGCGELPPESTGGLGGLPGKGQLVTDWHSLSAPIEGRALSLLSARLDRPFAQILRAYRTDRNSALVVAQRYAGAPAKLYLVDQNGAWDELLRGDSWATGQVVAYGHWLAVRRALSDPRSEPAERQVVLLFDLRRAIAGEHWSLESTNIPKHALPLDSRPSVLQQVRTDRQSSLPRPQLVIAPQATWGTINLDFVGPQQTAATDEQRTVGLQISGALGQQVLPLAPISQFDALRGVSEDLLLGDLRLINPNAMEISSAAKIGAFTREHFGERLYNVGRKILDAVFADHRFRQPKASPLERLDWPYPNRNSVQAEVATHFGRLRPDGGWYRVPQTPLAIALLSTPEKNPVTAYAWRPSELRLGLAAGGNRPEPIGQDDHIYGAGIPPMELLLTGQVEVLFNAGWHDDFSGFFADRGYAPHRWIDALPGLATLAVDQRGMIDIGVQREGRWRWSSGASDAPRPQGLRVLWQNYQLFVQDGRMLGQSHYYDAVTGKRLDRSALGITADRQLMIYAKCQLCSERDLAATMERLGAWYALPLDLASDNTFFYLLDPSSDQQRLPRCFDERGDQGELTPHAKPVFYLYRPSR